MMLKFGLILLLVFLTKISQDVLADSSSCSVPYIENGEMGKIQTTTGLTDEEFKKVDTWEQVNPNETLFLRCRNGFLPADELKFLESNRLEVTCNDGGWSKILPCNQTSCTGEPPATKNGIPVIRSREHGSSIWYRCENPDIFKVAGHVKCHFGSWIGNPPKCLNFPCNTRHLQEKPNFPSQHRYPGLIIPSQEYFESQEGFRIDCENGFRKATTAKKIKCNRGSWDMSENPCIDERDDKATSTTQPEKTSPRSEVPHVVNVESPDKQNLYVDRNRGCFCTYDNENYFLKAQIGNKKLKRGDRVMRGETMSLECNHGSNALMWHNGFRYFGKANMTCRTCENWQRKDLPTCTNIMRGDTFIASPEDFKILPGGIIDLRKGESRRFFCVNTEVQPVWSYVEKWSVSYNRAQFQANGNVMFMEIMDIGRVANVHSGKYECFIRNHLGGHIGSSFLELQVNDVTCPWFPPLIGLNVSYTDENKPESWATFSCASNAKMVGSRSSGCQYDGTWTATQPHCEYITCPWFPPRTGLNVSYSHENKPGSWATFSCASNAKLVGRREVGCQIDGTWSVTQPYCEDYVNCSRFPDSPGLKVTYSRNVGVGSIATFSCSPNENLIGSSVSVCRENGSWSNLLPLCEEREEQRTTSTMPPGKTSPEECFCTYDYENPFLKAQIGHRKLKRGDNIMRRETVSFECKFVSRVLSWQNGLRFFGKANMTCNTCKKWQSKDLPTCSYTVTVDAVIGYEEDLNILPGGIADMRKGENRQFFCSSSWSQPQWDYGEKKDVSVNITQVSGPGNVIFVSLLDIMRTEEEHSGKYECYMRGDHGQRIGSSFLDLQVDDDVSCSRFPYSPELTITYSKNVSVGSIATFSCSHSTKNLIGSSVSICKENRIWSNPLPSCEESKCSVDDLSISVPENVVPDVTGVNEEFLPSGSVVELKCSDNSVINGNSRALCGEHGNWEFGSFQCAPGCILNIDRSSHLLVQPLKDSYRLGEFLLLSCPPGEKMSSDVERLLCLGGRWSDSMPDCEE